MPSVLSTRETTRCGFHQIGSLTSVVNGVIIDNFLSNSHLRKHLTITLMTYIAVSCCKTASDVLLPSSHRSRDHPEKIYIFSRCPLFFLQETVKQNKDSEQAMIILHYQNGFSFGKTSIFATVSKQ